MSAWAAGFIGVAGTLLGAGLNAFLTARRDRDAWRRSELTRWSAELREVYAQYVADAADLRETASRVTDALRGGSHSVEQAKELGRARSAVMQGKLQIELLADDEVRKAAATLMTCALQVAAAIGNVRDPSRLYKAEEEYEGARAAFMQAARRSLRPAD